MFFHVIKLKPIDHHSYPRPPFPWVHAVQPQAQRVRDPVLAAPVASVSSFVNKFRGFTCYSKARPCDQSNIVKYLFYIHVG